MHQKSHIYVSSITETQNDPTTHTNQSQLKTLLRETDKLSLQL